MTPPPGELFPEAFAPSGAPSPVMAQYLRAKARAGNALLFFRLGDFYELFYEDAKTAARVLGITLTSRAKERESGEPVPMAGVPVRSVNGHLAKLVSHGFQVAICEQMEEAKGQKIIEREVVRLVTAGTLTEDELLEGHRSNYLAAVAFDGERVGLAWCDLSTGRFFTCDVARSSLADELARLAPAEVLISERLRDKPEHQAVVAAVPTVVTERTDPSFAQGQARRRLCDAFGVATLEGFGIDERSPGIGAAGAILDYLRDTQRAALSHLRRLEPWAPGRYVVLDRATREALELVETMRGGDRATTLLGVLDRTRTAMGGRRMREVVLAPLRDVAAIRRRQSAVAELVDAAKLREELRAALESVSDVERILGRIGCERGSPADLGNLRRSLAVVPQLRDLLEKHTAARAGWGASDDALREVLAGLDPCAELRDELTKALVDAPPLITNEGGIVREGYSAELDELRVIARDAQGWLARFEQKELARTGVPNLKAGFHRVYGYFLEVTNVHAAKVPAEYVRVQTLKDRERYTTAELREFESKVRSAETKTIELERGIFEELRRKAAKAALKVLSTARAVAEIDVLASLADVAATNRFVKPEVDDSLDLEIEQGRHPVVERFTSEPFVPNDCRLAGEARVMVLTGPNMAGKSTFLRQTALVVLLAQIGSFVPARRARVGVVDRISTRIGATDDLARGRSTFLVEMVETAAILNHATDRSLVVLDEVGRGTSTFDGLAIAWAVAEHLAEKLRARTIFATHYHELNELSTRCASVRNYRVDVKEWGDRVVFLRQVVEGGTDRSFGVHVARLAGIPTSVLARAREVLVAVQAETIALAPRILASSQPTGAEAARAETAGLFDPRKQAVLEELKSVDVNRLSPLDALLMLQRWKSELG